MKLRPINRGLVIIRRSTDQQDESLKTQLQWAHDRARELGVMLDADAADESVLIQGKRHRYRDICCDNAVGGDILDRPGFKALEQEALSNPAISHVFAFDRSRLARPESLGLMLDFEHRFLKQGITFVFKDRIVRDDNTSDGTVRELEAMLQYGKNHQDLVNLARYMLVSQKGLAAEGFTIGGTPPYGFCRVLYDTRTGKMVEKIPAGKSVTQSGCHVVWLPDSDHPERITTWIKILGWRESGLGAKKIARMLNELDLPSPNAGQVRNRANGESHVQEFWTAGSVNALLKNPLITGVLTYGRRSEGKKLRWSPNPNGYRTLEAQDYRLSGKPRTVVNDPASIITHEAHFPPLFDKQRWDSIQLLGAERSKSQRGVRRSPTPDRYPLSCRVFDLTEDTPRPMYGRFREDHAVYFCSTNVSAKNAPRYHEVDGEALFRYATKRLKFEYGLFGLREELYRRLLARAQRDQAQTPHTAAPTRKNLERKLRDIEGKIRQTGKNIPLITNPELVKVCEQEFTLLQQERDRIKADLIRLESQPSQPRTAEMAAEQALQFLDTLERISNDPSARIEAAGLFNKLNFRTGLYFKPVILGKKRLVNQLAAGVFTLGDTPFRRRSLKIVQDCDYTDNLAGELHVREVPSVPHQGKEMISYNKVCRGDRI